MVRRGDFVSGVPLPPGLDLVAIRKAIDYIERELAELVDLYDEQANVFSALVGIFGMKALDAVSAYEKHRHADKAQQRFPTFVDAAPESVLCRTNPWRVRAANVLGPFNRILIIPVGTLSGDISSIRPSRSRRVGRSSSGALTWCSSARVTGSMRGARQAPKAVEEHIHSASRTPRRPSMARPSIGAAMLSYAAESPCREMAKKSMATVGGREGASRKALPPQWKVEWRIK